LAKISEAPGVLENIVPADQKIDYLEFPACNLDAVQAFYEEVFGWTFTDYGPDYRAFGDGKMDGGFYRAEARSSTENGAVLVVIYATELEKMKARVLAGGGDIIKDIFAFPGGRRFHFADPNRNELAVWSDQ
jgi:uncharacterized protein